MCDYQPSAPGRTWPQPVGSRIYAWLPLVNAGTQPRAIVLR